MRKLTALLAVVLLVGCKDSKVSVDLQGVPPATQTQRYQIVINPHHKGDLLNPAAFLIDTEKGRVWEYNRFFISESGERQGQHFRPLEVLDDNGILGLTPLAFQELVDKVNTKKREREKTASTGQGKND